MTANTPIPRDEFEAALAELDGDALTAFVADVYAATADAVEVDGSRVTVLADGRRTALFVAATPDAAAPGDADVVVATDPTAAGDRSPTDAAVVGPADLRQRLLYAMSAEEANAIAERALDAPARSPTYEPVATAPDGDAAGDAADPPGAAPADPPGSGAAGAADDDGGGPTPTAEGAGPSDSAAEGAGPSDPADGGASTPDAGDDAPPDEPADAGGIGPVATRPTGSAGDPLGVRDDAPADGPTGGEDTAGGTDPSDDDAARLGGDRSRRVLAAVAVVALLCTAAAGAAVVAPGGLGGPAAADAPSDPSTDGSEPTDAPTGADEGGSPDGSDATGDDAGRVVGVVGGNLSGETERNVAPRPTCRRSALLVVQVQLNAVRYSDNATNEGVRTLRAFASPQNRDAVGDVDDYAAVLQTRTYDELLTYDAVEYSVPEVGDETAEVRVVTRENGTWTGRYLFRLVRVPAAETGTAVNASGGGACWMTDSVAVQSLNASSPPTGDSPQRDR